MRALDIPENRPLAPGLSPHAPSSALPQLPTELPRWAWRRRVSLLLHILLLALEGGWSMWGMDLTLLLLLLAASAACTAPTLLLLPFVAWGMAAPTSVRRCGHGVRVLGSAHLHQLYRAHLMSEHFYLVPEYLVSHGACSSSRTP